MTEVRETTRRLGVCANSVMSASVIPSTKYSSCVFPERFCNGKTASERIGLAVCCLRLAVQNTISTSMPAIAVVAITDPIHHLAEPFVLGSRIRGAAGPGGGDAVTASDGTNCALAS